MLQEFGVILERNLGFYREWMRPLRQSYLVLDIWMTVLMIMTMALEGVGGEGVDGGGKWTL